MLDLMPLSLRAPALLLYGVQLWRLLLYRWPNVIGEVLHLDPGDLARDAGHATLWLSGWYGLGLLANPLVGVGWSAVMLWSSLILWLLLPAGLVGMPSRGLLVRRLGGCLARGVGQATPLPEILLGDLLCSYAKVLADWDALLWCHLLVRGQAASSCMPSLLAVGLVCLPYALRLRQCWADWLASGHARHLVNGAKYAASFPAFYLAHQFATGRLGSPAWWAFWLTLNWAFSLGWDLAMDWGLLRDRRGLRPHLAFSPWQYYAAALLNALLRAAWVLRMAAIVLRWSPAFGRWWDDSLVPWLEISRRFLWLLLRLECERKPATKYISI